MTGILSILKLILEEISKSTDLVDVMQIINAVIAMLGLLVAILTLCKK